MKFGKLASGKLPGRTDGLVLGISAPIVAVAAVGMAQRTGRTGALGNLICGGLVVYMVRYANSAPARRGLGGACKSHYGERPKGQANEKADRRSEIRFHHFIFLSLRPRHQVGLASAHKPTFPRWPRVRAHHSDLLGHAKASGAVASPSLNGSSEERALRPTGMKEGAQVTDRALRRDSFRLLRCGQEYFPSLILSLGQRL